jgi:hypothetical protein
MQKENKITTDCFSFEEFKLRIFSANLSSAEDIYLSLVPAAKPQPGSNQMAQKHGRVFPVRHLHRRQAVRQYNA